MDKQILQDLFRDVFGETARRSELLPGAGSHRKYFRMQGEAARCIGVLSPDPLETRAFLEFTRHFRSFGFNVPELLGENAGRGIYLLQDLGDRNLKKAVDESREEGSFPDSIRNYYKRALEHLIEFQVEGHKRLDYSVCVPRDTFDRQSILWDLNHFKYFFIKLLGIPFDEQKLEEDFQSLAAFLVEADAEYFMYRDFQSRNILLYDNDLYFIDYQGGRKGSLAYDVASLLFESKIDLDPEFREQLLEHYLARLENEKQIPGENFMKYFYAFVLIRILQAMGAYGLRGLFESKALFLQSIPYGIKNIAWLLGNSLIPAGYTELSRCLERIILLDEWKFHSGTEGLTVRIHSFSYRNGLPRDYSGNGGGFVFDCRALPNPGREERFRDYTGLDEPVADFLEKKVEVGRFLEGVFGLIEQSVDEYRSRNFRDLMISFGCTGGRHRSVYCAEKTKEFLEERLGVRTLLVHRELKDNV